MPDFNILSGIIIPAVTSILLGLLIYNRQKKTDFEFDYRKYILQKRISAYEQIEKLLVVKGEYSEESNFNYLFIIDQDLESTYDRFLFALAQLTPHESWFSNEMLNDLYTFEEILTTIKIYHEGNEQTAEKHAKHFYEMIIAIRNIRTSFFKDIKALNKIDKFKKSKMFMVKDADRVVDTYKRFGIRTKNIRNM